MLKFSVQVEYNDGQRLSQTVQARDPEHARVIVQRALAEQNELYARITKVKVVRS